MMKKKMLPSRNLSTLDIHTDNLSLRQMQLCLVGVNISCETETTFTLTGVLKLAKR